MALRYLIPAGEQPDDAHADFIISKKMAVTSCM